MFNNKKIKELSSLVYDTRMKAVDSFLNLGSRIQRIYQDIERLVAHAKENQSAVCKLCGKRDFKDNLIELTADQMERLDLIKYPYEGSLELMYVHGDCAHINRSDDGKGWDKIKEEPKKKTK